jgi:RNA polymerase sigma-70 factor, ECF subfamily
MKSAFFNNRVPSVASMKHLSEEHLVSAAKFGNEQAFTELLSRYGEQARCVVWRILRNREDVDDVLQQAFLNSFLHLASFNGESRFSTWLNRVAINAAFGLLRQRRSRPEEPIGCSHPDSASPVAEFPDPTESIEERYYRVERLRRLQIAIQQLSPQLRDLIELRNTHQLPLKEIAIRTGLSLPTVKARLFRARNALRKHVAARCKLFDCSFVVKEHIDTPISVQGRRHTLLKQPSGV